VTSITTRTTPATATAESPSTRILAELEHARVQYLNSRDVGPAIASFGAAARRSAARLLLKKILKEYSLEASEDLGMLFAIAQWDDASPVVASATRCARRGTAGHRYLVAASVGESPNTIGTLLQWMCEYPAEHLLEQVVTACLHHPRLTVEHLRAALVLAPHEPLVLYKLLSASATFSDAHFVAELVWHFCPTFPRRGSQQLGRGEVWQALRYAPPRDVPALLIAYAVYDPAAAERYVYRMALSRRQAITTDEWSVVLTWPDPYARLGKLRHAAVAAMGFSMCG